MIGIFGGAFNPPHEEHIKMMEFALSMGLDEIVVVPSKNPPHKTTCQTPFNQRVDMLNIALLGKKNIIIDNIENEHEGTNYACEIIPKLKEKYGDCVYIIGGDSLIDFHTWKNPQEIIKMCPIWVFKRGENEAFVPALNYWLRQGADIKVLPYEPEKLASSLIRYYVALGYTDGIDKKVLRYIRENGLYSDYDEIIHKLASLVNEHRFYHSLGVAKYAQKLNFIHKLGLNQDKIMIAALLHDCAKSIEKNPDYDKGDTPKDAIGTPVEHQFLGAVVAEREFGVKDPEILNAIRCHTTGKPNMTTFEKLIYSADLLDEGREEDFIVPLRKAMDEDFEQGFLTIVKQQYDYLKQAKGDNIYPLTIECAKYYLGI